VVVGGGSVVVVVVEVVDVVEVVVGRVVVVVGRVVLVVGRVVVVPPGGGTVLDVVASSTTLPSAEVVVVLPSAPVEDVEVPSSGIVVVERSVVVEVSGSRSTWVPSTRVGLSGDPVWRSTSSATAHTVTTHQNHRPCPTRCTA
jgi:hypothetical protein